MRLLVAGDTHGNIEFISDYLYPCAADLGCDLIVQVGDFGYWEHDPEDDDDFLGRVDDAAHAFGIPFYWLRGNHDNIKYCLARYDVHTEDGFLVCRDNVLHIPDGHVWTWGGHRLRAFGGAYSVDKDRRLKQEAQLYRRAAAREQARRDAGRPPRPIPSYQGWSWFPEEELTDAQMRAFLAADNGPLDVVLSHDKPIKAEPRHLPGWRNLPGTVANQERLQSALDAHQPRLWIHGHLHLPYVDKVGTDRGTTTVVGLGCDDRAAPRFQRPADAWCVLELAPDKPIVRLDGRLASDLIESGRKSELPTYLGDNS